MKVSNYLYLKNVLSCRVKKHDRNLRDEFIECEKKENVILNLKGFIKEEKKISFHKQIFTSRLSP